MKRLILVDFDDTLVETAPAFQAAREALFRLLETEGFPRERSEEVHHGEVDPEFLARHGMGPFRMTPSFRETYVRLCGRQGRTVDPSVADACATLGRDFLGRPRVMDGSLEALQRLARWAPTAVFSQAAQLEYQKGRIRDAGVMDVLGESRILITEQKTPATFRLALGHFGVDQPEQATMIGNSLRSDINPALTVGARALLVEPYEMWHHDNVPPVSPDFLRFPGFPDAVTYLVGEGP
jgi:putative hydrolase of the HAD superfamily